MSEDTEQPESETAGEEARTNLSIRKPNRVRDAHAELYSSRADDSGPTRRRHCRRVFYVIGGQFVSTENAYVKADKIAISTNVPGRVIEVLISENDNVEGGQLLFRLNPEPFQIALNQATAKLDSIKAEIYELQAIYRQKVAELKVQQSDLSYFQTEFDRQVKLKKRGVVSQARLDEARRNVNSTKQRILAIRQEISRALARLGGDLSQQVDQHPLVQEAFAERERAALGSVGRKFAPPTPGSSPIFRWNRASL